MSLLNRRRALLSAKGKVLPYAYQQVEYLECSGTQYIDTLFTANQDTRIICKFNMTKLNTYNVVFWGSTGRDGRYNFYFGQQNCFAIGYGLNSIHYSKFVADTNIHKIDFDKNVVAFNDIIYQFNKQTFTCPSTIRLFSSAPSGYGVETNERKSSVRIYSCEIYDNDLLQRKYIPCYRKADNIAGMYNLVNGEFYTNQGTGEFILGGEV